MEQYCLTTFIAVTDPSSMLTRTGGNYYQLKKEGLALIFAVTKFANYLLCGFALKTDHEAMVGLFRESKAS